MLQNMPRKVLKGEDFFFILKPCFHNRYKVSKLWIKALKNDEDHELIIDPIASTTNKLGS